MRKMKIALLSSLAAIGILGGVGAANALTVSCQVTEKVHQTTDYKRPIPTYTVNYTITNRGWATPPVTGWFKTGIIVQRFDSRTGTTEAYSIPNDDTHFVKAPGGNRGYITADGSRQFTFTNKFGYVSDRDVNLNRTFMGACVKQGQGMKLFK